MINNRAANNLKINTKIMQMIEVTPGSGNKPPLMPNARLNASF